MGVNKRSAMTSPAKARTVQPPPSEETEPLKLFILPQDTSSDARFLLLDHPRDGLKRRFFFCPQKGLYGFTKIAAPSIDPTSILFAASDQTEDNCEACDTIYGQEKPITVDRSVAEGYVNKVAEFYVAAPFDLSFVLL